MSAFIKKNGPLISTYFIIAIVFWLVFLIIIPQLYMLDLSFRPNLPPLLRGGPDDVHTLVHYKHFIFGSEIKVITEFFNPSKVEVDNDSFNYFFSLGYIPAPKTIYKNLYKVLPSEILTIKDFKVQKRQKYWKKSSLSNYKSSSITSVEKAIEKSVEKMMVADVEVGCFLSGGIDSGLIVALASELSGSKLSTYTVSFEGSEFDESSSANLVAKKFNTNHQTLRAEIDLERDILFLVNQYDEPFGDSSAIPTMAVCREASN